VQRKGANASGDGAKISTVGSGPQASTTTYGNGGAHNNLPPYYALCYIYKL
jgi:hypothetical protein